jgi:hypothetical protein
VTTRRGIGMGRGVEEQTLTSESHDNVHPALDVFPGGLELAACQCWH